jgi:hypothetical protein
LNIYRLHYKQIESFSRPFSVERMTAVWNKFTSQLSEWNWEETDDKTVKIIIHQAIG